MSGLKPGLFLSQHILFVSHRFTILCRFVVSQAVTAQISQYIVIMNIKVPKSGIYLGLCTLTHCLSLLFGVFLSAI